MVTRPRRHFRWLDAWGIGILCCLAGAAVVEAADFRMVTSLYVNGSSRPVSQNLTLFVGGLIHDFSLPAKTEVTVLDTRTYAFTLLHGERRIQCDEVSKEFLLAAVSRMQNHAQSLPALPRFAANPTFEISYDDMNQQLVLASEHLAYKVTAQHCENASVSRQFRDFADWYARLNALLPGSLPPGARLVLNSELMKRQLIPIEIERRIPGRQESIVSRHKYTWEISKADQELVDRARGWQEGFRKVTLLEYHRLGVADQRAARRR